MKPRLEIHFSWSQQREYWFGKPYDAQDGEFLLNHARSGIMLALKALCLPDGSGVGVMAYNCHTVFNAISQAGYTPVFIDVTDSLKLDREDLDQKKGLIRALVITHLFGILNDISDVRSSYPELPIIEDCAHAFGIRECRGDFTVFSIGQGKFPSLGDGGILKVNNVTYLVAAKVLYEGLTKYPGRRSLSLYSKMVLKACLYSPFLYTTLIEPLKKRRIMPSGVEAVSIHRMGKGISAMYNAERLHIQDAISLRKQKALDTNIALSAIPGISRILEGCINGFMSVALCDDISLAKQTLREKGIEADTHFKHSIDWAKQFGYTEGACPNSESLIHRLLMVPTY